MADKSIANRKCLFARAGHHFQTGKGARAAFAINMNGRLAGQFSRAFRVIALTKYPMNYFVMPSKRKGGGKVIPRDIQNQQDRSRKPANSEAKCLV